MADSKHKDKVYEQFFPPDLGRRHVSPFLLSDSKVAEVRATQIPMTAHRWAAAGLFSPLSTRKKNAFWKAPPVVQKLHFLHEFNPRKISDKFEKRGLSILRRNG